MRRRLTPIETEHMMVPKIVEVIYPLLIPMEQQDCQIQAQNYALMTTLATELWRSFTRSY